MFFSTLYTLADFVSEFIRIVYIWYIRRSALLRQRLAFLLFLQQIDQNGV